MRAQFVSRRSKRNQLNGASRCAAAVSSACDFVGVDSSRHSSHVPSRALPIAKVPTSNEAAKFSEWVRVIQANANDKALSDSMIQNRGFRG